MSLGFKDLLVIAFVIVVFGVGVTYCQLEQQKLSYKIQSECIAAGGAWIYTQCVAGRRSDAR